LNVGSDPGDDLEFFGTLNAQKVVVNDNGNLEAVETRPVFYRDKSGQVSLSEGGYYHNPDPAQELIIEPGELLQLSGGLIETDNNGDDTLSGNARRFPYHKLISGPQLMRFEESDQAVEATFEVTVH
jgi:hypothetical protein